MVSQNPTSASTSAQVTDLVDGAMGSSVGFNARTDPTRDNIFFAPDASLAAFFERPIVAATYTWTPAQVSPFTAIFNPWTLFFGNKRVINRLNNYSQMRANLHVRYMINGNGFYYGRLMADYAPLSANDRASDYSTLIPENAVQASQRMKVFIDPGDCCTQEMYLPFVWHADSIKIASAEWSSLGQVYMRELNGLKHANASTQPVTITIMLWATDVMLSLPTSVSSSALIVQAGDEYSEPGPVQRTATAVASMAKRFTDLPHIGPYARATSIAAGATAKVAGIFGLSRPCNIAPNAPMRPTFVSSLAPSDAGDTVQKLTVDSKQEIALDPSTIGIDLPDELSIAGLAARESYLTTFTWATAKVAGDLLWNTRVGPNLCRFAGTEYFLPAPAFASYPFEYWRGKMRLRFQIVASGYHRGRLRLVWDPQYAASLESNVQYTRVVDISDDRDITVEVDWGQANHFLPTSTITAGPNQFGATAFGSANANYNGVLGVYVFNDLATPNSTVNNDIQVNVFVSFDDFQVASPVYLQSTQLANRYSATVQAGEDLSDESGNEPGCGDSQAALTMGGAQDDANDMAVYFGERVASFRQLLRRYTLYQSFVSANTSAVYPGLLAITTTDVPIPYGYNNFSFETSTAGDKFNYVGFHWLTYLAPAFACVRGSTRSKYITQSGTTTTVGSMSIQRNSPASLGLSAVIPLTSTTQSTYARACMSARSSLAAGGALTVSQHQPVLEVEFPYQKPVRFDEARALAAVPSLTTSPFESKHRIELFLNPGTSSVFLDRYVSVGEDFNFIWFQGCPPLTALAPPA